MDSVLFFSFNLVFLYDSHMKVICENDVFKLYGLADEAVCVVLEDIKVVCISGLEVVGALGWLLCLRLE